MLRQNIKERINFMQKFILSLLFFLLPLSANAFTVKHDFFVTVGFFDASKTSFAYTLNQNSYKISSDVKTNGFFDTIYPFQAIYNTTGIITDSQMQTTDYNYTAKSKFNTRTKKVFYQNGIPQYQISGKNGKEKKREFAPAPTPADTFDLQTVMAKIAKQYNEVGFCDSFLRIYDGKRRFNVAFKDEGTDKLESNEHSFYSGEAAKCSMNIVKELSEDDDELWEFSSNKPVYFWIAKDKKSRYPFIAKVQIKQTPLGELNAYTTNITIEE